MALTQIEMILKRASVAKDKRRTWDVHWQEVADLVDPTREFSVVRQPGSRRRLKIYDDTAPNAHEELAATIDGLLTNSAQVWFSLIPSDDDLVQDHEVKLWLEDASRRMLKWLSNPRSGFATAIHEIYLDLTGFGTAILLIRDDPDATSFQAMPLNNVYLEGDERQQIIGVYRFISMPAHEVVKEWPDTASDDVRKMAEDPDRMGEDVQLLHCVQKREERNRERRDGKNKPWASFYIEVDKKSQLSEAGFDENPYITPRFAKAPGEIYGRSPAIKALPAIKTANVQQRTIQLAGAKFVDPPMNVPANSMKGPIRMAPGAINYFRVGTKDLPTPMNTGAQPLSGVELLAATQVQIETAFFLDKIRLPGISPQGGHARMTVPEVIERRNQTLIFFSPILARLYAELLTLVITRTYRAMRRRGEIPPPPEAIAMRGMDIEYQGPLSLSQKASEVTGFIQLMDVIEPLVAQNPAVLLNIDDNAAVQQIAHLLNTSPRMMRPPEEVVKLQQALQEAQQVAREAELAQTLASAGRDAAAGIKDVTENAAA